MGTGVTDEEGLCNIEWTMDTSKDLLFKTWMNVTVQENNNENNKINLPSPPISYEDVVSTCTRNVLIRHAIPDDDHYTYVYEPAQMTIRIF